MLGGVAQHLLAHRLTAREEDHVEPLLQQGLVLGAPARDHGHVLGREAVLNDGLDHGGGGGGVGRGLDDGGVAGGDGVGQGLYGEEEGVVPGAHDEDVAVGGGQGVATGGELSQGGSHPMLAGVALHVAEHMGDLGEGKSHLAHEALIGGLAQICLQGGGDLGLPGPDGGIELFQHGAAEGYRQGGAALEKVPLGLQDVLDGSWLHGDLPMMDGYGGIIPRGS